MILGRSLKEDVITLVKQFYGRNDVSSTMPGMKDAVSLRTSDGKKQKVQKEPIKFKRNIFTIQK